MPRHRRKNGGGQLDTGKRRIAAFPVDVLVSRSTCVGILFSVWVTCGIYPGFTAKGIVGRDEVHML
jgi:hypothetical protein